ncbi:hypothetical protein PoB_002734300 [Plakobranchus ocellatus]|uniref:Secreted protein n=1 Tax=Plakobranchus ocellatus TaxID=259542 RepID=A0AAV4A2I6_9GAST|nr:hypothetical protein PoB_002734300 [Plakobranchus ocellatus]
MVVVLMMMMMMMMSEMDKKDRLSYIHQVIDWHGALLSCSIHRPSDLTYTSGRPRSPEENLALVAISDPSFPYSRSP